VSKLLRNIQDNLIRFKDEIYDYFYTTDAQWNQFININNCKNEGIWVFLVSCGYALGKNQGLETLSNLLLKSDMEQPSNPKIFYEAQPISPRIDEGNTCVDLAIGAISRRQGTGSGIKFDKLAPSWICFCEAKFDSDISGKVKYDPNRNQLARVIENAICFQDSGNYVDGVYVTIITPKAYRDKRQLLERKFFDYNENKGFLLGDLNKCCLNKRQQNDWIYPEDIEQRFQKPNLQRVYFEDLIDGIPASELSESIKILSMQAFMK